MTGKSLWRIAAALVLALSVTAAQAAIVTVDVKGSWTGMRTWNPGQLGGPVVETNLPGGGPNMQIKGTMTFDDGTGIISALDLTGTKTISVWATGFGQVTLDGFSWTQSGTSLLLNPGSSIACEGVTGANTACGPGYQFGQGTFNTLSSFTGVIDDGKDPACIGVMPGPAPGECLTVRDGIIGLAGGAAIGSVTTLDLWKGFNPFIPLASNGTFVLETVPVPGAVWLFGSALGFLGWLRRKIQ